MLEEALRDPAKHPAEVAQAMLSFVRSDLPNGGSSSEERFINLVLLLCTRVFGGMQEAKEFRHEAGGWLSAQNRWKTPSTGATVQQARPYGGGATTMPGSRATPSIDADPVVQLLGPEPSVAASTTKSGGGDSKGHLRSLIETISAEVESRPCVFYRFPFPAMPESLQRQYLMVLESLVVGSTPNSHLGLGVQTTHNNTQPQISVSNNSQVLFQSMRLAPESQDQVRAYQQRKLHARSQAQPLQLSPGLASPQSMTPTSPSVSASKMEQRESTPNLFLSMLEYYMFLFIRYPMAAPVIPRQSQSQAHFGSYRITGTVQRRQETPYGERIYCALFSRYLRHFLPHGKLTSHDVGVFPPEKKESEFFLRVVVAFWLESHGSLLSTAKAAQGIVERFHRNGVSHSPSADMNMSYDLTIGKFDPPPTIAQICLRRLVVHTISDPAITACQNAQSWCLSPAMTVLQQPFYNYIRSTFRHASIHSQGSTFYTALNAWLIWLEPWNVNHVNRAQQATKRIISTVSGSTTPTSSSPTLSIPAADKKSSYAKSWQPYVAANLFLYTVPLAIFLRRARELDFSPREMSRSMRVVKRVFRVFTPEVVNALENITKSMKVPEFDCSASSLQRIAEYHRTSLLEEYAPSLSGNLSLSCCQADMQGLLEEIQMQHLKKVRDLNVMDKFAAFLEGLFGQGVMAGEEMAIQSLVERAKTIVGLPIDYEIFSVDQSKISSDRTGLSAPDSSTALRTSKGVLTDEGRRQLLMGSYKCSPTDVNFIGNRMQGRLRSHEIAFLVTLTTALSNWLNKKFGLLPLASSDGSDSGEERLQRNLRDEKMKTKWQINLRWLADYRNFVFTALCAFCALRTLFA